MYARWSGDQEKAPLFSMRGGPNVVIGNGDRGEREAPGWGALYSIVE
jgi:hypothetical protein